MCEIYIYTSHDDQDLRNGPSGRILQSGKSLAERFPSLPQAHSTAAGTEFGTGALLRTEMTHGPEHTAIVKTGGRFLCRRVIKLFGGKYPRFRRPQERGSLFWT